MTDAAAPPAAPKQPASLSETKVPVVQIMASNIKEVWPSLIHSVKYSSFIAIDLVSVELVCAIRQYIVRNKVCNVCILYVELYVKMFGL